MFTSCLYTHTSTEITWNAFVYVVVFAAFKSTYFLALGTSKNANHFETMFLISINSLQSNIVDKQKSYFDIKNTHTDLNSH